MQTNYRQECQARLPSAAERSFEADSSSRARWERTARTRRFGVEDRVAIGDAVDAVVEASTSVMRCFSR
jgi:hypothetical protein